MIAVAWKFLTSGLFGFLGKLLDHFKIERAKQSGRDEKELEALREQAKDTERGIDAWNDGVDEFNRLHPPDDPGPEDRH